MDRRVTYFIADTEIILAIRTTRHYLSRQTVAEVVKAAIALIGLATVSFFAVVLVEHTPPLTNAPSEFGVEIQTLNLEAVTGGVDTRAAADPPTDMISAASKRLVVPNFDYFPDRILKSAAGT